MRIAICTLASNGGRSGIGEHVRELLGAIEQAGRGHAIESFVLASDLEAYPPRSPDTRVITVSDRFEPTAPNLVWHQAALPWLCWQRGIDVLLLPAANRRVPAYLPCPAVGTVHDLAILHEPGKYDALHRLYTSHLIPPLLRRLRHVIAVSEWTRQDLLRICGLDENRVSVVHNGVDTRRFTPRRSSEGLARLAALGVRKPYILYVARLEHPGKNHLGLLEAYAHLRGLCKAPLQLVLAGPDCERAGEIHHAIASHPRRDEILCTGYLDRELLPDLYRECEVLVQPSLIEGFGLPVLEAQACGAVVAASRGGALPEVAGHHSLLFEARDTEAMAHAMHEAMAPGAAREQRIAEGLRHVQRFSWQAAAQATLDILERAGRQP